MKKDNGGDVQRKSIQMTEQLLTKDHYGKPHMNASSHPSITLLNEAKKRGNVWMLLISNQIHFQNKMDRNKYTN